MHPTDARWIEDQVVMGVLQEEAKRTLAAYQRMVADLVDPVTGKFRVGLPYDPVQPAYYQPRYPVHGCE